MKNVPFFFLSTAILFFCSCKKGDGNNWDTPRVKTESMNGSTQEFYYDNMDRIKKVENAPFVSEYRFDPGKLVVKYINTSTNETEEKSFPLNGKGLMDSADGKKYAYDAENRLLQVIFPPDNAGWVARHKYYYNSSGMLDSIVRQQVRLLQTRWVSTSFFYYYTAEAETAGNENRGLGFYGKGQPHPVKEEEIWKPIPNAPFREMVANKSYHYGYDANRRTVRKDITDLREDGSIVNTEIIYTYY